MDEEKGKKMSIVDWSKYAANSRYDAMATHNPEYARLLEHTLAIFSDLPISAGSTIADLGGGTGNFSLAMAHTHPDKRFVVLDTDPQMICEARLKSRQTKTENFNAMRGDMLNLPFEDESIDCAIYIHSAYTLPTQKGIPIGALSSFREAYRSLKQEGHIIISDIGREIPVSKLALILAHHNIKKQGLLYTARLYMKNIPTLQQNSFIRKRQSEGTYWLHNISELEEVLQMAKFKEFSHQNNELYFGLDDFVVAKKIP